jgi:hypothetical protein
MTTDDDAERFPPEDRPQTPRRGHVVAAALGILLLALMQAAPAIRHLDLATAPAWARLSVLLALLETAYAVWVALATDWSTLRVAMFLAATVATLYSVALGASLLTPAFHPAPLDMHEAPGGAPLWCATIVSGALSLTYACGRLSHRWRQALAAGQAAEPSRDHGRHDGSSDAG